MTQPVAPKTVLFWLAAILTVATIVRVAGLRNQGLLLWDEGYYMLEARYWIHGASDIEGFVTGRSPGTAPYYGRPLHVIVVAIAMSLVGDDPIAGQLVSVTTAILTILIVFFLGTLLVSVRYGLVAAGMMAVLPYHIIYSRMILPESSSTFLLFAGLLLRVLGYRRLLPDGWAAFLSGLFLGLATTASFRIWPFAVGFAVLQAMAAAWLIRSRPARMFRDRSAMFVSRLLLALVGCALPLCGWQAVFLVLRRYAIRHGLPWNIADYFQQVWSIMSGTRSGLPQLRADYSFYAKAFWRYGSPLFAAAVLAGLVLTVLVVLRSENRKASAACWGVVLLTGFVAPFLFYSILPVSAVRYLAIGVPGAALLAGACVETAFNWKRPAGVGALLALLASEAAYGVPLSSWQSGFREVHRFVATNGARVITTQEGITNYYAPEVSVRFGPLTGAQLREAWNDGFDYMIVDDQGQVLGPDQTLLRQIELLARPVYSSRDAFKTTPLYFLEQDQTHLSFEERISLFQRIRNEHHVPTVRIYRVTSELVARLAPSSTGSKPSLQKELLTNGGFDRLADGLPERWIVYGDPAIVPGGRESGSGWVVCTHTNKSSGFSQSVPVVPGQSYLLSEWVRSNSSRDELARLQVNWGGSDGQTLGAALSVVPALRGRWANRFALVNAPENATTATVYASVHGVARVCFDDIEFGPAIVE